MEGRREDVDTSPSLFSSAVSPPCQVDGLSQIWWYRVVYTKAPKWTVCSHKFPGIDVNLAFLDIMFGIVIYCNLVVYNLFLARTRILQMLLISIIKNPATGQPLAKFNFATKPASCHFGLDQC